MTELAEIFDELDLAHYLDRFLEQGFDTCDTILDITEADFDVLGVKLGHRRKLQRKIATTRGMSHNQALALPKRRSNVLDNKLLGESKGVTASRSSDKDRSSSIQPSRKRKYTKHPKPDPNAPAQPRSAYVIFSNKVREDLKGESLSFTEIAKLVGEKWQNLTPGERKPYEQQGFAAKETFRDELAGYKMTKCFNTYAEYLQEFHAKQLHTQESNRESPKKTYKAPKLQNIPSAISIKTAKFSSTSSLSHEAPSDVQVQGSSLGLKPEPRFSGEPVKQTALPSAVTPSTQDKETTDRSSTTLIGYYDTVIGANPQTLAWRDCARSTDIPVQNPRPWKGQRVTYCKVKLFRIHGAERKLSNDVAHMKKSMDKLERQLAVGMKDFEKRKRTGSVSKSINPSSPWNSSMRSNTHTPSPILQLSLRIHQPPLYPSAILAILLHAFTAQQLLNLPTRNTILLCLAIGSAAGARRWAGSVSLVVGWTDARADRPAKMKRWR
ncbi:hypothetical protein O988_00013 [Pseudogymnoascus sp. VKM F-3808]|nr:hypothetical protein O988_00013 [Pseudogymnoascus sp. VKM F-3808]